MKAHKPENSIQLPLADRSQGGRLLAAELLKYRRNPQVIVLALPRGGLPVGYEISKVLDAPMDALLVRKLGVPGQRELAFGAIAVGGVRVVDREIVGELGLTPEEIEATASEEQRVLEVKNQLYRGGKSAPNVRNRIAILVDDGIATGSTMRAAVQALRNQKPARIVVAAPVASAAAVTMLRGEADEVVCLAQPEPFYAVGCWYRDFSQISDEEAGGVLEQAARAPAA